MIKLAASDEQLSRSVFVRGLTGTTLSPPSGTAGAVQFGTAPTFHERPSGRLVDSNFVLRGRGGEAIGSSAEH